MNTINNYQFNRTSTPTAPRGTSEFQIDVSEYNQQVFGNQTIRQPIIQNGDLAYITKVAQLALVFGFSLYARTYMAMLARAVYPTVYSLTVGEAPNFYSIRYHVSYAPSLEYFCNQAYQFGPYIVTAAHLLLLNVLPLLILGSRTSVRAGLFFLKNVEGVVKEINSFNDSLDEDTVFKL